jgi:hypothetical protein
VSGEPGIDVIDARAGAAKTNEAATATPSILLNFIPSPVSGFLGLPHP